MHFKYKGKLLIFALLLQLVGLISYDIGAIDTTNLNPQIAKDYFETAYNNCKGLTLSEQDMRQSNTHHLQGLLKGELLDLDNNGIQEMILLRKVPVSGENYGPGKVYENALQGLILEIYTYTDQGLQQIYEINTLKDMPLGLATSQRAAIKELENSYVLVTGYESVHSAGIEVKSLKGTQFETQFMYTYDNPGETVTKEWYDVKNNQTLSTEKADTMSSWFYNREESLIDIDSLEHTIYFTASSYNGTKFLDTLEAASITKLPYEDITESFLSDENQVNTFLANTQWLQHYYATWFKNSSSNLLYDVNTTTLEEMLEILFLHIAVEDKPDRSYKGTLGWHDNLTYDQSTDQEISKVSLDILERLMLEIFGRVFELEEGVPYSVKDNLGSVTEIYTLKNGEVIHQRMHGGKGNYTEYQSRIHTVYDIGDDMYVFVIDGLFRELDDPWSQKTAYYTMLVQKVPEKEGVRYVPLRLQRNPELTPEMIEPYKVTSRYTPNIDLTYKENSNSEEALAILENALSTLQDEPNNLALTDIQQFISHHIRNSSAISAKGRKNEIKITDKLIKEGLSQITEIVAQFTELLHKYQITLPSPLPIGIKIDATPIDWQSPVTLEFDRFQNDTLQKVDHLLIVLGDIAHRIEIPTATLQLLSNSKIVIHQVGLTNYQITFTKDKQELSNIEGDIYISLPVANSLSTVYANYKGHQENWGGQINADNTISFNTRYAGQYEIKDIPLTIEDISNLTPPQQESIEFMVSKGLFELNENQFIPYEYLTRYDFCKVLVKMFFALNVDATTSFTDIEKDNLYYSYIASGEGMNIIKGFDDITFKGDQNVTKEQVLAFCSRVLIEELGINLTQDIDMLLNYLDKNTISPWAKEAIALTVQEGLIEQGGMLFSANPITRAEAAEILYNLFNKLYVKSPTTIGITAAEETTSFTPIVIAVSCVILAAGVGFVCYKKYNMH